jgi:hypothetical protein
MHEPLSSLALGALLVTLPGCFLFNPDNSPPDQVATCQGPSLGNPPPSAMRKVAVGDGTGSDFHAYQEGDTVHLVTGGQGLTMMTPVVRVEAAPGDPSEMCLFVHLTTDYVKKQMTGSGGGAGAGGGGGAAGGGGVYMEQPDKDAIEQFAKFVSKDGAFLTDGPLYNPLNGTRRLDLYDMKLTLEVRGESFVGAQTVTVHP